MVHVPFCRLGNVWDKKALGGDEGSVVRVSGVGGVDPLKVVAPGPLPDPLRVPENTPVKFAVGSEPKATKLIVIVRLFPVAVGGPLGMQLAPIRSEMHVSAMRLTEHR